MWTQDEKLDAISAKLDKLIEFVGYTDNCTCMEAFGSRAATWKEDRLICDKCHRLVRTREAHGGGQ